MVANCKNIQFLQGKFSIAPFVMNYRSAEGSIIQLLVRINTLIHSFTTVFLLFLKNTVFTRGTRAKRAKLWKETTIIFPIHFFGEQKNLRTCHKCKTERCQKRNAISRSDKGETAVGDRFRQTQTRVPRADGGFIVMAAGRESQRGETRDHKKGWRHGWALTHVPLRRGILFTWPLVCHHVTRPVMSLHPACLCSIVLYCMWTRE